MRTKRREMPVGKQFAGAAGFVGGFTGGALTGSLLLAFGGAVAGQMAAYKVYDCRHKDRPTPLVTPGG